MSWLHEMFAQDFVWRALLAALLAGLSLRRWHRPLRSPRNARFSKPLSFSDHEQPCN